MNAANATAPPENLKALTSLRFFAAMMIVAYHMDLFKAAPWILWVPHSFVHGVSFFFVLSGFILTHVYRRDAGMTFGRFMSLRVARLYPTVLASMTFLVLVVPWADIPWSKAGLPMTTLGLGLKLLTLESAFPVSNVQFSWNAASWSISTEMYFYLAFPFLLKNLESTWARKLLLAAYCAVAVFAVGALLQLPVEFVTDNRVTVSALTYANPLVRGFEFVLGMSTYLLWSRRISPLDLSLRVWTIIEMAALLLIALWLTLGVASIEPALPSPASMWFDTSGSCFLFAGLILVFASGRGWLGKLLTARVMVWLGEVSFAIYLYHQIVLRAFGPFLLARFSADAAALIALAIILAIAAANHRWLEPRGRGIVLRTSERWRLRRPGSALAGS